MKLKRFSRTVHIVTPLSYLLILGFFIAWAVLAPGRYMFDMRPRNLFSLLADCVCWVLFTVNVVCIMCSLGLLAENVFRRKRLPEKTFFKNVVLNAWPVFALFCLCACDFRMVCDYFLIPLRMLPIY